MYDPTVERQSTGGSPDAPAAADEDLDSLSAPRWYRRLLGLIWWIGAHERVNLLLLLLLCGGAWGLAELTDEVMEGSTGSFDRAVILGLRSDGDLADPLGPHWVEELARDATALGGVLVALLATGGSVVYLLIRGRVRLGLYLLLSVGCGLGLSTLGKTIIDRPRPDLVPHGSLVSTASFPSGHSMMSAVIWFTIAALLMHSEQRAGIKFFIFIMAVLLCLVIGISRVYLGVHWPTDVLAGWTAGAAWAIICHQVAKLLRLLDQDSTSGPPPSLPIA